MQDMTDALSKHPFDDEYHKRNKRKAEQRKQKPKGEPKADDDDDNGELNFTQALKKKTIRMLQMQKERSSAQQMSSQYPKEGLVDQSHDPRDAGWRRRRKRRRRG